MQSTGWTLSTERSGCEQGGLLCPGPLPPVPGQRDAETRVADTTGEVGRKGQPLTLDVCQPRNDAEGRQGHLPLPLSSSSISVASPALGEVLNTVACGFLHSFHPQLPEPPCQPTGGRLLWLKWSITRLSPDRSWPPAFVPLCTACSNTQKTACPFIQYHSL